MVKNEDVEDRTDELWKLEKGEAVKTIKSTIRLTTVLLWYFVLVLFFMEIEVLVLNLLYVFWYQLQPTNT